MRDCPGSRLREPRLPQTSKSTAAGTALRSGSRPRLGTRAELLELNLVQRRPDRRVAREKRGEVVRVEHEELEVGDRGGYRGAPLLTAASEVSEEGGRREDRPLDF